MASRETPPSALSAADLDALNARIGPAERKFMRELLQTDEPRQAMVFAELLHYFPGSYLVDEPEPEREGQPLTAVVNDMFPEMEDV